MTKKNFLLTPQGLKRLLTQSKLLEKVRSKLIRNDIQHVQRDSELDPEYAAVLEELSLIEQKANNIKDILDNCKVVKVPSANNQKVAIGAKVELLMDGKQRKFEIVDMASVDPDRGRISDCSPIGKVLIGKKKGEMVFVSDPLNKPVWIKNISYV